MFIKTYLVPSLKTVGTLLAGAALTFVLWEGYYYWQVLKWVDAIRVNDAIRQAAQSQQTQQKAPPPAPEKP